MKPGDIVYQEASLGHHKFWLIEAICLGGLRQENLIRLRSLTEKAGVDDNGEHHETTLVPASLLRSATVYTPDIGDQTAEARRAA